MNLFTQFTQEAASKPANTSPAATASTKPVEKPKSGSEIPDSPFATVETK